MCVKLQHTTNNTTHRYVIFSYPLPDALGLMRPLDISALASELTALPLIGPASTESDRQMQAKPI